MIKILNIKNRNFKKKLDESLSKRRNKIQSSNISVKKIIQDVKKNGDKSILKYEKRFNKNKFILPNKKTNNKNISGLDSKIKKAINLAYARILKFHSLQKFNNISYQDKLKNK